jgi:hypothetical protein
MNEDVFEITPKSLCAQKRSCKVISGSVGISPILLEMVSLIECSCFCFWFDEKNIQMIIKHLPFLHQTKGNLAKLHLVFS